MEDLFARGRARYVEFLEAIDPPIEMPLGIEGVSMVLYEDFIAHPARCYEFVRTEKQSIVILGQHGDVEMLMARHRIPIARRDG